MKTNPSTTILSMSSLKKLSILLCCSLLATQSAFAETEQVNPPLPGIGFVIKKNPGSGQRSVPATDAKGQTTVSITEAGDYTFTLTRAEAQGGAVKGVKVAMGKNPSGRERPVSMVSNAKGEVTFKNLEVGNYTLLVVAAEAKAASKAPAK